MIAILQPHIPHYREAFFKGVNKYKSLKVYCYESAANAEKDSFKNANIDSVYIKHKSFGSFKWFDIAPFLTKEVNTVVLMLDFKHISTWYLLLTKFMHKKNIILWGQGISIKRFLRQEKKTFIPLKYFLKLSSGVWFYTDKELNLWKKRIPKLNAVALNNTISGIEDILHLPILNTEQKLKLRSKYKITQPLVLIFCARFNAVRRVDLLVELIKKVDSTKIALVIIGDGAEKPSFNQYAHVYDFGKVYDFKLKTELFSLADIYFQPGWLGLSIVEAMAYAKPIFSFYRKENIYQCVEYSYIVENENGKLFNDIDDLVLELEIINLKEIYKMGERAKMYCKNNLTMDNMINKANILL